MAHSGHCGSVDKLNIGVVGGGYWGPNLIRNFSQIPECNIKICCDLDEQRLQRIRTLFPGIQTTRRLEHVLEDAALDGVAIATPVRTHAEIARQCLEGGKHVLVEKPLAASSLDCLALAQLAEKYRKVLMVGHTFEFAAAVNMAREIIASGELGEIHYISCVRVNLGLFQPDINVIWDLAPHDISILLYILQELPTSVSGQGKAHFRKDIEDVAVTTLNFPSGTIAFIHNSWLDPDKIRRITVVGSKKMLVYDDVSQNEKLKIYDKGVEAPPYYSTYAEFHFSYRYGDIYSPRVPDYEPLRRECEHFLECIRSRRTPQCDGYSGLRIVTILEAANRSLRQGGSQQTIPRDIFFPRTQDNEHHPRTGPELHPGKNPVHSSKIAADVKLGKKVRLHDFVNLYGCEIGDYTKIGAFVEIQKGAIIGKCCKISSHTFICTGVTVEDEVFIGHNVTFINDVYPRAANKDGRLRTEADWTCVPTRVKRGASIGSSATVLCGVAIGENAVVGAGSVVTKDVPANTVVAGNPARVLRKIAAT
jgi:predicted dehydrogenase/acetyltransferase-like isoleucine patch superfamily enzyme